MEKQKIYTVTISIVVIAVLFLITIFIFKNKALLAIAVQQAASQEVFSRNIVPRNITPEISKIKSFLADTEIPKNTEVATNVRKAVENATNAWTECQELVNSKRVNIFLVKGTMYMANYEDTVNKTYFHIVFYSKRGELRQCTKSILPAEASSNNKRKFIYQLYFNEDYNIQTYRYSNGSVDFYPSGSIERMYYDKPDGIRHSIVWSEDGNIIRQGIYDMNNKGPLLLEAEERAKKLATEFHENAQKEYEEYKRKLNKEEK